MPAKNKPKRLDRNRAVRVARRKKKQRELVNGKSRNRKPRPKHKGVVVEAVKKVLLGRVTSRAESKMGKE
ncbi:MAG: hypothetical protein KJ592_04260 [Nanoarchaeota archaeon]|nr:hypothetical protein [Nanoarchaeota archaeon]